MPQQLFFAAAEAKFSGKEQPVLNRGCRANVRWSDTVKLVPQHLADPEKKLQFETRATRHFGDFAHEEEEGYSQCQAD